MSDREALTRAICAVTDGWGEPLDEVDDVPQIVNAVMALDGGRVAELEAEVARLTLPCDRGCYDDGPMEDCSQHGRPVAEVWQIVAQVTAERDAARAALAALREAVEGLADDMDDLGRPGASDSPTDMTARRQIREDAKRLRALLAATPSKRPPGGQAFEHPGHEFIGVAGHPDDDECTHRADGTDLTYCGLTEAEHTDGRVEG